MHLSLSQSATSDTLLIPVIQNDHLVNTLSNLAPTVGLPASTLEADFKADAKEVLPIYQPNGRKTYLIGLGKTPGINEWFRTFRKFFYDQKNRLPQHVGVDLRLHGPDAIEGVVLGAYGGGYDLKLYQTDKPESPIFYSENGQLSLLVDDPTTQADALRRAEAIALTQRQIMDLMNAPSNYKTPQTLADWAVASGRQHGYSVRVLNKAQIEQEGLQALLAVNRGSDHEPVFIIAEYKPEHAPNAKKVGLVGKGITFDTGGISIKPSANMHMMKSDMGGAAAVLGTLEVAAKLKLPVHLIGIVPSTENMVDGSATKPGDVIGSYLGKTIEVIDTDAEGRIILADGLGYMVRNYGPDVLIDLATLTGSVIATLGYHAAGLFTNNDELAEALSRAATQTGERVWRLPLWDVYAEDIRSDVADLKNFSGKPMAGAISAGKFLEVFTENHPAWVHLDIAGTAFGDTEFGSQKNGTGFGIRLLIDWLRTL
ncbi:leucyl aminopeptidase [Rudanella paleaurantiibacter]|uniref:Probable cytosol aminopeptidase n=1 Tax=Rudanella paleaurantiibacter TaxID=2614655 RepID=A0A7J5U283_9BACT|nr:leucyl aminopeptidase [Rudanella paleaurantiibacter]KAB7731692.1 leucyl aminopeptidase [Rudanella paleaurantiibacter]